MNSIMMRVIISLFSISFADYCYRWDAISESVPKLSSVGWHYSDATVGPLNAGTLTFYCELTE
ncbi:hypothetical protein LEP1GSC133_2391 [Leptospira borgpetersenii serovar Pomona str. 200901868]|uniref:Uncharacterized protein n=2 Tax=Leptospira borgpetersenii TaxID=174 RepID=M6WA05_LEPBO|nr:hypothetical protein LEP1GSC055_3435 [Leptospira borgpetersenii str. Brem 307]EMN15440.1 hypothetical protein LEP1GSC056_3673 [Leptospira borgpetersenii str. Brem 328]EMN57780.1 hypothetical protein LEP1GSC090_0691 [Leptospira borgpetersenii serovar Javanica str. MK146]EMO62024.1 hypothetical protein LEP1GSC133_2391 [Leptospira borgpetersenii serovar Pomona str. 200901868]